MARLPTKQDEQSILRSFANMQNDIFSGNQPEFLANTNAQPNGIPPFNNAPTFEQAFESGLSFPQAVAASSKVASDQVKSQVENEIKAAQNTPENRANIAAAEILRAYPAVSSDVSLADPYEIVFDSFSNNFGFPKEDIKSAIESARNASNKMAIDKINLAVESSAPMPQVKTEKPDVPAEDMTPKEATEVAEGLIEDIVSASPSTSVPLEEEAAGSGMPTVEDIPGAGLEFVPGDVFSTPKDAYESVARQRLGQKVQVPGLLDQVLRGFGHSFGMAATAAILEDKPFDTDYYYNYLTNGQVVNPQSKEAKDVYSSIKRAENLYYKEDDSSWQAKIGSHYWTDESDNKYDQNLSEIQAQNIGYIASMPLLQRAIVDFNNNVLGQGFFGESYQKRKDQEYRDWSSDMPQIITPTKRKTGYIEHSEGF